MVNEEGRICISDSDLKQATLVLESVVKGATPKEKSTSLDPEVHKRVLNRLAVDQIEYSERVIEGHTFLVWNSDDDDRVRAIIDEEFQKYAEEKFGKDFGRE